MKGKMVFLILLAFFWMSRQHVLYAQNFDLKYYSSVLEGDFQSDYSGVACAVYINKAELKNMESKLASTGREFDKLTKSNSWLCWKALGEWDIEDGETYLIVCADSMWSQDAIMIIATIKNGGKTFNWWGKGVTSNDLK
jgi:hypothetical protein